MDAVVHITDYANKTTEDKTASKKLVAYFSATGTTAKVAETLADAIGEGLFEIKPAVPYTQADLNWMDEKSRSTIEMHDKTFRPAIADTDATITEYDVIFVGFPIWWYVAPTIINTFLEKYDFSGKKIVLFATSGGSEFGKTVEELKVSVSDDTTIIKGSVLNEKQTYKNLAEWVDSLNL